MDDCSDSPCGGGICNDGINDYDCICFPGFTGKFCETSKCFENIFKSLQKCSELSSILFLCHESGHFKALFWQMEEL